MESKMTDYISRKAAIEAVKNERSYVGAFSWEEERAWKLGFHQGITFALSDLSQLPAADVREVVYCKDCYAYRKDKELAEAAYLDGEKYCALIRCEMPEDGFCWYGKRICGADMREDRHDCRVWYRV